ncbi:MAG: hypothetical protein ACO1QR_02165, partial [Chthoniobacteraceae bacterium]
MKLRIITAITALSLAVPAFAAEKEKHDHDEVKVGPTNGKLITKVEPHVEFLVTKEKKVELRFVDGANKVVSPGAQEITVTMGERSKPTKLTFAKQGDKLVSSGPIPAGNEIPTVVQIREKAGAKAVNETFNLNLSEC